MEAASLALLFKVPGLLQAVAGYLGLVESVDQKVDRLIKSDFNAGTRCMQEVLISEKSHDFLLREAWKRFHTALTHETGERKALALLGLAMCQDRLGETLLATATLKELSQFEFIDKKARFWRNTSVIAALPFAALRLSAMLMLTNKELVEKLENNPKVDATVRDLISRYGVLWKIPSEEAVKRLTAEAGELVQERGPSNSR